MTYKIPYHVSKCNTYFGGLSSEWQVGKHLTTQLKLGSTKKAICPPSQREEISKALIAAYRTKFLMEKSAELVMSTVSVKLWLEKDLTI